MHDFIISLVSGSIGSLLTLMYAEYQYNKSIKKKCNELYHATCFYLAMQCSELANLKKNIEYRLEILKSLKTKNLLTRNERVSFSQDFILHADICINMENISGAILSNNGGRRGILENLQSVHNSNKLYQTSLAHLEKFNKAKLLIEKEESPEDVLNAIYDFGEKNFPEYLKQIENNLSYSKSTIESFKATLKEKLKIEIKIDLGEIVQIT